MADYNNRGDRSGGGGRSFGGGRNSGRPSFGGGGGRDRDDRPQMYKATCGDCGDQCEVPFRPSGDRPVLCKDCFRGNDGAERPRRDSREKSFGRDRDRGGRDNVEMHKATCSDCGDQCEVPFRPSEDKPVFCSECFGRNKSAGKNSEKSNEQLEMINAKLDKILKLITPVIAVSKEMKKEHDAENVASEVMGDMPVTKPKKAKKAKKIAEIEKDLD